MHRKCYGCYVKQDGSLRYQFTNTFVSYKVTIFHHMYVYVFDTYELHFKLYVYIHMCKPQQATTIKKKKPF